MVLFWAALPGIKTAWENSRVLYTLFSLYCFTCTMDEARKNALPFVQAFSNRNFPCTKHKGKTGVSSAVQAFQDLQFCVYKCLCSFGRRFLTHLSMGFRTS